MIKHHWGWWVLPDDFNFDQKSLRGLQPGSKTLTISDPKTPGLVVRVTPMGVKTYYFVYRMGGRGTPKKWLKVGTVQDLPLVRAQEMARTYRTDVDHGVDPAEQMKAKTTLGKTINDLADQFERDYLPALAPKTRDDYKRTLRLHIRPLLGKVTIAGLDRIQVQAWHGKVQGPRNANLALAILSCMMTQSMLWGLRTEGLNPCAHVSKHPEIPRSRDVNDRELAAIGKALCDLEDRHPVWSLAAIRMTVLCWGRISEVLSLRRDMDCFLDEGYAVIREHKTSRKHGSKRLELPPQAVGILRGLPEQKGNPYYFPSPTVSDGPLTRHGVYKTWRAVCELAEVKNLHLHDFRSLAASEGEAQGVPAKTMARVLGHADPRTTMKHYTKARHSVVTEVVSKVAGRISAAMDGAVADSKTNRTKPK